MAKTVIRVLSLGRRPAGARLLSRCPHGATFGPDLRRKLAHATGVAGALSEPV